MRIELNLNATVLQAFLKGYPHAMSESINLYKDRVGRNIERRVKNAPKNETPHITGNLKRQTQYKEGTGIIYSYAEYAKYVHGKPYYDFESLTTKSGRPRKITPFFTYALERSESFIAKEQKNILKRVLK